MNSYDVRISPSVVNRIAEYATHIAEDSGSADVARRWTQSVYQKINTLNVCPKRYVLAQENDHRAYEIRRQLIGNYVIFYSVDEESTTVSVIGFRHAKRLPIIEDLPQNES